MTLVDIENAERYADIIGFLKREEMIDEFEELYGELQDGSRREIKKKMYRDSEIEAIAKLIEENWDGNYLIDWDKTDTHILVFELNSRRTAVISRA